jgi:hypothetical protein
MRSGLTFTRAIPKYGGTIFKAKFRRQRRWEWRRLRRKTNLLELNASHGRTRAKQDHLQMTCNGDVGEKNQKI